MRGTSTPVLQEYGLLLDGQWRREGVRFEVLAPHDRSPIAVARRATAQHVEQAIAAAARAFELTRKLPTFERQRILRAVSEGIAARKEEFVRILALEAGKPIKSARVEVERTIFTFALGAEECARIYGEWLPLDLQAAAAGRWGVVRRFPIGPVASITPYNFPLNLVAHKWAPAIAAGCTIVHKPAPQTPLTSLLLAELVAQSAWPAGALNVLPLSNEDAAPLVTDERIKLLSFTGSAAVGWELKKRAGKKRVALELGGIAGTIIHSDAELAWAAERCVFGGFSYAGQSCISVQRIFVQQTVFEKFLAEFVPRVRALKLGEPLDETTDVGPMISEAAAQRASEWVEEACAAGARALCGGGRRGAWLEPTVLTGTRPEQRVNCQEIFAPVVTVEPYGEFPDALRRVDATEFGLQAGVFTRDLGLVMRAYEELDVGGVIVNDVPTFRMDHMPYGGAKDSGAGREGLRYAIEEMTERKLLVVTQR
jgi:acyl-CoA reductase-like NAD-dependent aldehyde dehydrogenase